MQAMRRRLRVDDVGVCALYAERQYGFGCYIIMRIDALYTV